MDKTVLVWDEIAHVVSAEHSATLTHDREALEKSLTRHIELLNTLKDPTKLEEFWWKTIEERAFRLAELSGNNEEEPFLQALLELANLVGLEFKNPVKLVTKVAAPPPAPVPVPLSPPARETPAETRVAGGTHTNGSKSVSPPTLPETGLVNYDHLRVVRSALLMDPPTFNTDELIRRTRMVKAAVESCLTGGLRILEQSMREAGNGTYVYNTQTGDLVGELITKFGDTVTIEQLRDKLSSTRQLSHAPR